MDVMQQIARIEEKIQRLTAKVAQLQSENDTLRLANEDLKTAANNRDQQIVTLTANLDKTRGILEKKRADDPKDIQQLRKQLAEYITELDQVITILQSEKG